MLAKYFTEKNIDEKREVDELAVGDQQDNEDLTGDTENNGSSAAEEPENFNTEEEEEDQEVVVEMSELETETSHLNKKDQVENREVMHNCFNSLVNDLNKHVSCRAKQNITEINV